MDISTRSSIIKTPVNRPEAEQHATTSQEFDPGFLQLLAGLGLIPPILPKLLDADQLSGLNGGPSHGIETMPVAQAGPSATATTQEKIASAKTEAADVLLAESIQSSPQGPAGDLLALISAGKHESAPPAAVPAQPVAVGKPEIVKGKSPVAVASPPDITGAVQNTPQATVSKDVPQAVLAKLVDAVSSEPAPAQRGTASTVIPSTIGSTPNAAIQPSAGHDMPIKQTSASSQPLIWDAVMEPSNLPGSGKDNNSASADHSGDKARFLQADTGGNQVAPAPVTSSFSPQPAPAPTRSSSNVEAPTVTAPLEASLPASVRFEVQQGDMGRIRVHVSVVDHTVYTNVMTERIEAHDFLVKGSDRYEAGLAAHGLDVGRFQVDVQGQSREHADRGGAAWSHEQTPRNQAEPPDKTNNSVAAEWQAEERKVGWENRMVSVFA